MLNIDNFTIGNLFKNDSGEIYKVVSNWGENKRIYIELQLYDTEFEEKLEPINT